MSPWDHAALPAPCWSGAGHSERDSSGAGQALVDSQGCSTIVVGGLTNSWVQPTWGSPTGVGSASTGLANLCQLWDDNPLETH